MLFQSILLALITSLALGQSEVGRPCGFKMAPCPFDMKCVPDNAHCPHPSRCPGHCEFKNKYDQCGGFTPRPHVCRRGSRCQDDPRLPPNCGMACDAPGICIPENAPFCGGFMGNLNFCSGGGHVLETRLTNGTQYCQSSSAIGSLKPAATILYCMLFLSATRIAFLLK
ncbi:hypothetical protein MKX07_004415 [Trichoderma sp. CBMAI-0711]|nr:hypothetical protein MKX07_004415 [Trichoderma sp. CBMAI-0711]